MRGSCERQVIYYTAASRWESEMCPAFGKYLGDSKTDGERMAENLYNTQLHFLSFFLHSSQLRFWP